MKSRILFIEDNITKAEDVKSYVEEYLDIKNVIVKESFVSGLRELFLNDFDILLLDMSLPTRETQLSSSINNFEQLGGYQILSEMKRKGRVVTTILITMFSEFGVGKSFMNIEELNEMLIKNFGDFYKGYVFYSSQEDAWKENLKNILDSIK